MGKSCGNCANGTWTKGMDAIPEVCLKCEYVHGEPSNWKEKTMTNADRIRAMSDEELAKWLLDVMSHKVACFGEGAFKYSPCRNVEHDCLECGVVWLKQPVEVDNG